MPLSNCLSWSLHARVARRNPSQVRLPHQRMDGMVADLTTAVMPYFPYSRQSKKKSHRGAITARMLANQLEVAGVNHVITIDLHASQMQGFFRCPVDNLIAEPTLAHWIKLNVPEWRNAVCVSKNPGGTKRTTSLADALKLNFGIMMTDRARPSSGRTSMANSTILPGRTTPTRANGLNMRASSSIQRAGDATTPRQQSFASDAVPSTATSDLARTQTAPSATQVDGDDAHDEVRQDLHFMSSTIELC